MASKKKNKPTVSSKAKGRKKGVKLGYTETSKNINTLRKLRKVQQEEEVLKEEEDISCEDDDDFLRFMDGGEEEKL
jgi:hypothetical protein